MGVLRGGYLASILEQTAQLLSQGGFAKGCGMTCFRRLVTGLTVGTF